MSDSDLEYEYPVLSCQLAEVLLVLGPGPPIKEAAYYFQETAYRHLTCADTRLPTRKKGQNTLPLSAHLYQGSGALITCSDAIDGSVGHEPQFAPLLKTWLSYNLP